MSDEDILTLYQKPCQTGSHRGPVNSVNLSLKAALYQPFNLFGHADKAGEFTRFSVKSVIIDTNQMVFLLQLRNHFAKAHFNIDKGSGEQQDQLLILFPIFRYIHTVFPFFWLSSPYRKLTGDYDCKCHSVFFSCILQEQIFLSRIRCGSAG